MEFSIGQFILGNIAIKYFILSGLVYWLFWIVYKRKLAHRFIQKTWPKINNIHREIKYSVIAMLTTMTVGVGIFFIIRNGYTVVYSDIAEYGWWWYFLSFIVLLFLHDAWFYWSHRFMHLPKIFKIVHLAHHKSTNPSPWATFAFHPLEALINNMFFIAIIFTLPCHSTVLIAFGFFSFFMNLKGHLGFEIFPKWFINNKWVNWNTSSTHHNMHHKYFDNNYGFYFTFWDKWMGTEAPNYKEVFEEVTSRNAESQQIETLEPSLVQSKQNTP